MSGPRIDRLSTIINPFMNADCRIHQRGSSATGTGTFIVDRLETFSNVGVSHLNDHVETGGPNTADTGNYPINAFQRVVPQATATPTTNQRMTIQQQMEAQFVEWVWYKRTKFGFFVKTNKAGTYSVQITGPSGTNTYVTSFIDNGDNTWKPYTFEIDMVPALSLFTPDIDNGLGLVFNIVLDAGPDITNVVTEEQWNSGGLIGGTAVKAVAGQVNFHDNTSNDFKITGFRALPLDYAGQEVDLWAQASLHPDVNLTECQRYYEKSYSISVDPGTVSSNGFQTITSRAADSDSLLAVTVDYLTKKRLTSVVAVWDFNGNSNSLHWSLTGALVGPATPVLAFSGDSGFSVGTNNASALVTGQAYALRFHFTADAEF